MRKYILLILLTWPFFGFSQQGNSLQNIINSAKERIIIDPTDKSIVNILDKLFEEGLQSDNPSYSPETLKSFQAMAQRSDLKNSHILALLMMYQNHITEKLNKGNSSPKYQIEIMDVLVNEAKDIYGKVPVMLYIYQIEAYNADKNHSQVREIVTEAKKNYPNAIPLKVYDLLNKEDETLRQDIVTNHANHWLVKQFKIN